MNNKIYDDSLILHQKYNGKIKIETVKRIEDTHDLSLFYSPGVASSCLEIKKDPSKVFDYTLKKRVIAVISDGSAVLGLGNIGAKAGIPVMEGKCMLFKEFADVEAFPICLDTQDTEEIISTIKNIAPVFGGINLEDISAPRCIEIEKRLSDILDIPVFHDDQKGTAIVVGAAVKNICRLLNLEPNNLRVALSGTGAAGSNIAQMLKILGIGKIYAYNVLGAVSYSKYDKYDFSIKELLDNHIVDSFDGDDSLAGIVKGADIFIGVSVANILSVEMVESMRTKIILALANPNPEIAYEDAVKAGAKIIATGRSDYPNQINNVLVFPGFFKGLLMAGAKKVTDDLFMIAVDSLSSFINNEELSATNLLPSALNKEVANHLANTIYNYLINKGETNEI